MHFFYLDEAGCNGRDLANPQQPIFVIGGISVLDQRWNRTNDDFNNIIQHFFNNDVPENFELHAEELFSPNGDGPFEGIDRVKRNQLAHDLLDLLSDNSHPTFYHAVDKAKLIEHLNSEFRIKTYLDFSVPYLISFDYIVSLIDWYTKKRLGHTARALLILDEKEQFEQQIEHIVNTRKYTLPKIRRLKWLVEFTYPISSHKNPMVQFSDLVCYLTKKFLEIENGYREEYTPELKDIFRDFYRKIDDRLIRKTIVKTDNRNSAEGYFDFLSEITSNPTTRWNTKNY